MAEYTNDLRLKEIATGDESGTWGTSTNTNLELIAEAFSYSTVATFDTDADKTETIADGSTDPYRSIYVKVTSGVSLTATRTLTIAPNTVSKIFMIENATSGSQSIAISQGSGANVTIPNGDVKVIYTDGAGAGAAVVDAFASLNIGDLTATNIAGTLTTAAQTNITSVGTLSSLTVSGDLTVDTDTLFVDASADSVGIGTASPDMPLTVVGNVSRNAVKIITSGTGTEEGILYWYASDASTIRAGISGNVNGLDFKTGASATQRMRIDSSGNVGIGNSSPQRRLVVGDGSGSEIMSIYAGNANSSALHFTDTNTTTDFQGFVTYNHVDEALRFGAAEAEVMRITSTGLGIGTTNPSSSLHVQAAANNDTTLTITGGVTPSLGSNAIIKLIPDGTSGEGVIDVDGSDGYDQLELRTGGTTALTIDGSQNVGIGTSNPSDKLHVSSGNIRISGGSPSLYLYDSDVSNLYHRILGGGNAGIEYSADVDNVGTGYHRFDIGGSEAMRLIEGGSLGIGTSSPGSILHIGGGGDANVPITIAPSTGGSAEFRNTSSTGIFKFTKSNGSTEVMRIDGSGNVGIGTTSPTAYSGYTTLALNNASNGGVLDFQSNGTGVGQIFNDGSNFLINANKASANLIFRTGGTSPTERMRITDGGDLLVGATSNTSRGGSATKQLIKFGSGQEYLDLQSNTTDANSAILFSDGSTGNYGAIRYRHNGDSLEFMTASTEAMRIDSSGDVIINNDAAASVGARLTIVDGDGGLNNSIMNTGYTGTGMLSTCERSASSAYFFFAAVSGRRVDNASGDTEFSLRGDGNGYADGSWNGGGADYAEYFEWQDGNPDNEDRVGYAVSLVGNKIKIAEAGEEIIGVVSGNPSVVGDTAWNDWQDKYLKDDFGRYLWEEYADEDGNTTDDNGDLLKRRVLNPDYDDSLEYQPREDRQEWDVVGLMGKLRVRVGQQTNSNWIKLRDISDTVEEWLVR